MNASSEIEYRDAGKLSKAIELYERALSHKDDYAYYCLGKLYTFNGAMPLNLKKSPRLSGGGLCPAAR